MRRHGLLSAAAALSLAAADARADGVHDLIGTCFARAYDAAYLAGHGDQQFAAIKIGFSDFNDTALARIDLTSRDARHRARLLRQLRHRHRRRRPLPRLCRRQLRAEWRDRTSGAADVRGVPAVGAVRPLAAPMRPQRPQESPRDPEHGADAQGTRSARAAGTKPVEQGNRPCDADRRRNDQVASEEPFRQARRRHAQAGRAAAQLLGLLAEAE